MRDDNGKGLLERLHGQSALLFSGFAMSQAMSFGRNAIVGHWLSRGDFGIAATLTLLLQLVETLSDVGVDRMIVQARDGDEPRLLSSAHLMLILRGMATSVALFAIAGPVTSFFRVEDALSAFQLVALVPMIKGFMHLDSRRFQRRLVNGPQMMVEVIPQGLALALVVPVLSVVPGYGAIVWLSFAQAALAVLVSHRVSERVYRVSMDRDFLARLFRFGWPIWLSAVPLVAVFHGDRIVIGRVFGMEALAGYSAAFMMTMVPGLVAAKIGHALMLPLLADRRDDERGFNHRFSMMADFIAVVACVYVFAFVCVGGRVLPIAFGPNYHGLDVIVSWLAVMWSLRMVQAVPGMGLMALGDTRPLLVAGFVRGIGLVGAIAAVICGLGIVGVVVSGVVAELASLVYVSLRMSKDRAGSAAILMSRAAYVVPVALGGFALSLALGEGATFAMAMFAGTMGSLGVGVCVALAMPGSRRIVCGLFSNVFGRKGVREGLIGS